MSVLRQAFVAVRLLLVMTVVLGVVYPVGLWLVGRVVPDRADGSFVRVDGVVVGSALIGQEFDGPEWFHPRPSAAGYDALSSGGSNLALDNPALVDEVARRRAEVAADDGVPVSQVPADAVTASGSGLDPDISPEYADLQVDRVARERSLDPAAVAALVADHVAGRTLGVIGAPHVNVLELNIALEQLR